MKTWYVMPGLLVALTAVAALFAGCGGEGKPGPQVVGEVDDSSPIATLGGIDAWQDDEISAGSIIETGDMGWVIFHTDDVESCRVLCNSRLQVRPDEGVAIRWLGTSGSTWCKKSGGGWQQFSIKDEMTIRVEGTVFGVQLREEATLARLVDGSAVVSVEGQEERIQVEPGQELVIPVDGAPAIRPLTLSDEEQEIVRDLGRARPTPAKATPTPERATRTPEPTPTDTPTPEPDVFIDYFEIQEDPPPGCAPVLVWFVGGDPDGTVELLRDGVVVYTSEVVDKDSYTDYLPERFAVGNYTVEYKLRVTDSQGRSVESEPVPVSDQCWPGPE